jgi:two-component system, chemotaxis family, protein-glutamate methylesterase/glutaminase
MSHRIRVLVVDDSSFARVVISREISSDPEIEVVGVAVDGIDAIEKIKNLRPDVVTLDIEMPRMDGVSALRRIMVEHPTPVIVLSRLTVEDAETTIQALEAGAIDFVPKSPLANSGRISLPTGRLIEKIKLAAKVDVRRMALTARRNKLREMNGNRLKRDLSVMSGCSLSRNVVIIGSSTGGPKALCELVPDLPGDLPASLLIVQHMPAGFTKSLAKRLDQLAQLRVKEAEPGDLIRPGKALVAPGGYHLVVNSDDTVSLSSMPPKHGLRPAVDVTMEAAARAYGDGCIGVVLTGMGCDGRDGAVTISKSGGRVVVQDEATSVVYGMPRSVVESGRANKIVPLPEIAQQIVEMCMEPVRLQIKT